MQLASTQAPEDVVQRTAAVIAEAAGLEGPLLPILHGLQEEFGFVPSEVAACGRRGTQHIQRRSPWRRDFLP